MIDFGAIFSVTFPDVVLASAVHRRTPIVTLPAGRLLEVGRFLRDAPDLRYDLLSDLTVVDTLKLGGEQHGARFHGIYQLRSIANGGALLQLKAPLPGGDQPVAPSVASLWPTANWHEREAYDLFGVRYEGHPDLRRILMPDDWLTHPLRKDQPLGGERVPFSMTWEDEEFAHLGKQIMQTNQQPEPVPGRMDSKHMVVNMGPQHPATHGVLRLIVELDGERIIAVQPDIGYLHSGFEKQGENIRYKDFVYYTDRMDYVSAMQNNLAYCLAVEKLMGIEAPPRGQAIRVIICELQRIASHLVWLATHVLDVGGTGMSLLMYAFREREEILDLFEMVCGARLTTSYLRVGGVNWDLPPAFEPKVRDLLGRLPARFGEYERMLTDNPVFRRRLEGIGVLSAETCIAMGITGPMLRGSGVKYDLRKTQPYCNYDHYDFEIPCYPQGDSYARYFVRLEEMRQSVRIVRQALDALPDGDFLIDDPKIAPPKRELLDQSMEAVIHHFKLFTEGFRPPVGEAYHGIEASKGEMGVYLISDGSAHPYRCRVRTPSFVNLQSIELMSKGHLFSDLVTIIGSIDIVLGDVDR
ncbi:MAG: NADH dehydrogenase (quinone) subunit D [Caldilineales bacterium]|nr:NADH dehydrogenase (quinone) subunit D [Caldilineales bacterium]MCW5856867.1 NADH dehydrogenase (quinone) subunit D [Caldilineales bacterium]